MEAAPLIQGGIAIVGALTAYFAAQRGVAVGMAKMQKDIDHTDENLTKEVTHIWDEVGRDRNSGHRGRLHTLGNSANQHEMRIYLLEQGTPAHGMPKPKHPFEDN